MKAQQRLGQPGELYYKAFGRRGTIDLIPFSSTHQQHQWIDLSKNYSDSFHRPSNNLKKHIANRSPPAKTYLNRDHSDYPGYQADRHEIKIID